MKSSQLHLPSISGNILLLASPTCTTHTSAGSNPSLPLSHWIPSPCFWQSVFSSGSWGPACSTPPYLPGSPGSSSWASIPFLYSLPPWSLLRAPVVGKVGPVFLTAYPTPAGAGGCQGQTTSVLFQQWHSPRPNESSLQGTDHLFSHGTSDQDCPPLSFLKSGEAQARVPGPLGGSCSSGWLWPHVRHKADSQGRGQLTWPGEAGRLGSEAPCSTSVWGSKKYEVALQAALTVLCPSLVSSYETLAVVLGGRHSKSPMNERVLFWQLARYLINTISYMLLHSNRFVTLFSPIIY